MMTYNIGEGKPQKLETLHHTCDRSTAKKITTMSKQAKKAKTQAVDSFSLAPFFA